MRSLFIISLLLSFQAFAADPSKPHPHKGSLPHYDGAPPDPEAHLTPAQAQTLASGKAIYTTAQSEGGGGAVAIFKVAAPSKMIWRVINNFPKYPEWIGSQLERINVYKRDGDKIFVEFDLNLGWLLGNWTYYVEHYYPAGKGWGTWKLDYNRLSDLDDSVGFWRVREIPNSSECVVTYSVNISVSSVPSAVSNMIGSSSVEEAIKWVKEQSEALVGK